MIIMDDTLHNALKKLTGAEPEPRGWFRWLHNHYLRRYGVVHKDLVYGELYEEEWQLLSDEPTPLYQRINDPELMITFLNSQAWAAGMFFLFKSVGKNWKQLNRTARGNFFAGITEHNGAGSLFETCIEIFPEMEFTPESLCQLACNAIKYNRLDLLKLLLSAKVDLTSEIRRFDVFETHSSWEIDELKKLSHRVIDMILEAALIQNKPAAAKMALEHGADPNIPVWQLERSYNKKYSALGYAIDSEFQQNNQPHREMAELLLEHGASPVGIPYAGMDSEFKFAVDKEWHDFAKRLISMGAQLTRSTTSEDITEAGKIAGSEPLV